MHDIKKIVYLLPYRDGMPSVGTITIQDGMSINDANRVKAALSKLSYDNKIIQDMLNDALSKLDKIYKILNVDYKDRKDGDIDE